MSASHRTVTLPDRLRYALIRAGAVGLTAEDFPGYPRTQVSNAFHKLAARGLAYQAKVEGHRRVRWFNHECDCDAYVARLTGTKPNHRPGRKGITREQAIEESRETFASIFTNSKYLQKAKGSASWSPDEPAITPPHVKVQVCPGYKPQFQALAEVMGRCSGGLQRGRVFQEAEA